MGISIDQLAGGGASERIQRELNKIAENVLDPNTKPDATRKLTIEISIKPNEARQLGDAEITVKSSLAPAKGLPSHFVFDWDKDGNAVMQELKMGRDLDQMAMADNGAVVDGTGAPVDNKKVVNMSPYR
ncbi:hypothetical protein PAECIP111893_00294 [Paenibacillus plantiphilus]|uniref:Replication terminator protein n=1 Tax=Paenibacillus plantiphilus TaxID=2905650 RepID=A0ABM9BM12_9BACL|nr:hypothetical protein [Paenibacillus plantiphilus]CAH1190362.1 hypothetical protein PAECIP111893_00294 [Paenibacillus plantiphilus]